jgi:glyoxylase-like metal-dependent hydrolase (beta-lactamase superfamily II)
MLTEIATDVRRLTLQLPVRPGHVHMYLLRDDEGWTLVDTGLALPELGELLEGAQRELDAPIVRIVVTHMHPDHVGGAAIAAEMTGAPVYESALDYEQCVGVWGNPDWPQRIADWFLGHGVPAPVAEELIEQGSIYAPFIRIARDPWPLAEGDDVGGWRVLELPGHADGHLCLYREGVLVSGDHLLDPISPAVGLWPEARPDPLGDYIASLERTIWLAPQLVLPGHGEPIADPIGRARALLEHHRLRLDATAATLDGDSLTGYDVSLGLFGANLAPSARRFAVAETLSHLERLRRAGRAERAEEDGVVRWAAAV